MIPEEGQPKPDGGRAIWHSDWKKGKLANKNVFKQYTSEYVILAWPWGVYVIFPFEGNSQCNMMQHP